MASKLRKFVKGAGVAIAALCALGIVTLPMVTASYKAKAVLTQRVQVDAADKLFGDGPTEIGSPQLMIIDDPKAIVGTKDGVRQVNDAYLTSHHIYPLQLKTVDFTVENARLGLVIGLVIGWLAFFLVRRIEKKELEKSVVPIEAGS
jgi:hypothetical protein